MPYLSPTLSNRRRYSDLVRAEAPLARENYYAKRRRDLEEERLAAERSLAERQLTQQQSQFDESLAEMRSQYEGSLSEGTRQHEESLAEMRREYEEGLAETTRRHEASLASEQAIADKNYALTQEAQKEAGKQADIASGIGIAGLGLEAYPYLSSLFSGGAAAGTTAAAVGAPAAAGATATGGTAAGASTLAGSGASSGTTAAAGMSAGLGAATAIGIPLAIAIGSGHFKQLGKGDTPGIQDYWPTYTPEQKEAGWQQINTPEYWQQQNWVMMNDPNFMTPERWETAFLSAPKSERGWGDQLRGWFNTLSEGEKARLRAEKSKILSARKQEEPGD